jgi:hypothetical protein
MLSYPNVPLVNKRYSLPFFLLLLPRLPCLNLPLLLCRGSNLFDLQSFQQINFGPATLMAYVI